MLTPEVLTRLDEFVDRKMGLDAIPGLSMAVTDRTKDLHVRTLGVSCMASGEAVREDTLFQIGSISKFFTCIALMQLHEKGAVDVTGLVKDYLPWFEVRSKHPPITLHHLMTHTAGIPCGSDSTVVSESEVWGLRHLTTSAPPGEHFHYSNTGYKTLGLVLEAVTGRPYAEVIRDGVLRPLGMDHTEPVITNAIRERTAVGYTWLEDDRPPARKGRLSPATWFESNTGDGSISSTPRDMSRYLRMVLNRGVGPEGRLISEDSFQLMTSPLVTYREDGEEGHYGYGIDVEIREDRTVLSHTGGMVGYTSSMLVDLGLGLGVIILTNSVDKPEEVSRFFVRLLDASVSGSPLPLPEPPSQTYVPDTLSEYVGLYRGDSRSLQVTERDGRLWVGLMGMGVPTECVMQDYFKLGHPDFCLFLLRFLRSEERVVGVAYGSEEYRLDGVHHTSAAAGPRHGLAALTGHYRSHNPWLSNFRVVARGGTLYLIDSSGVEMTLWPIGEATFRVGDDPLSPETLKFGMFVDGKALMADLSGGKYHRTFTP